MKRIDVQYHSYSDFVQSIAGVLNVAVKNNQVELPTYLGHGSIKSVDLGNGLSVLMAEADLIQDIVLELATVKEEFFILHFLEVEFKNGSENKPADAFLLKSGVYVRSSLKNVTYFLTQGSIRSVSIIVSTNSFKQSVDKSEAAFILDYLRSLPDQTHHIQLIDVEYRNIIAKLFNPVLELPLKKLFIGNRTMLLIENFFIKHHLGQDVINNNKYLTAEELERLTVVENKLVNGVFEETPTIEGLAKIAAMSATKLKRSFKSFFGLPVYEYYQKHRMNVAKEILLSGKYTVKQAGQKVGYQNISHFATAFKKIHGVLPSQVLVTNR